MAIEFYFWPTPNTRKVAIFLEEAGIDYTLKPVDIAKGEQFEPAFLSISPNHRVPAIVHHRGDGETISLFESGAILLYLAEEFGCFLPEEAKPRAEVLQWLFWQMAGLGPMAGQLSHFVNYAPPDNTYSLERYSTEYGRLLSVMDKQLEKSAFLAGDYSIADMACFPWLLPNSRFGFSLDDYPRVRGWFDCLKGRDAVRRAVSLGSDWVPRKPSMDDKARSVLFGQTGKR